MFDLRFYSHPDLSVPRFPFTIKSIVDEYGCWETQVKDTKGAEIEEDLRTALRPWHRDGKFALVRKVSLGFPPATPPLISHTRRNGDETH